MPCVLLQNFSINSIGYVALSISNFQLSIAEFVVIGPEQAPETEAPSVDVPAGTDTPTEAPQTFDMGVIAAVVAVVSAAGYAIARKKR